MAKDKKSDEKMTMPFGRTNYILLAAALVVIVLGYIFLGTGDITLAPILLVIGYCVLIPAGIIWPDKKKRQEELEQAG